jgi:hypothetical protein
VSASADGASTARQTSGQHTNASSRLAPRAERPRIELVFLIGVRSLDGTSPATLPMTESPHPTTSCPSACKHTEIRRDGDRPPARPWERKAEARVPAVLDRPHAIAVKARELRRPPLFVQQRQETRMVAVGH